MHVLTKHSVSFQERTGARKEIRAENAFLAAQRVKFARAKNVDLQEKTKAIFSGLASQDRVVVEKGRTSFEKTLLTKYIVIESLFSELVLQALAALLGLRSTGVRLLQGRVSLAPSICPTRGSLCFACKTLQNCPRASLQGPSQGFQEDVKSENSCHP